MSCPRCRYLGFSHNAIGPPHLTAFVSFRHFENNVFNNTKDMSIDNILSKLTFEISFSKIYHYNY